MFGLRRYRLFLLVAAFSAATLYYVSQSRSWGYVDFERLGQSGSKSNVQSPQAADTIVQPPPVDEIIRPADPPAQRPPTVNPPVADLPVALPSQPAKSSALASPAAKSSTAPTDVNKPGLPTTSGEEFLLETVDPDLDFAEEGSGRWDIQVNLKDGRKPKWTKTEPHFPLAPEDIIRLPTDSAKQIPKIQAKFESESPAAKKNRITKLNTIKESFKHAWNGYKQYGLPHDELKPISQNFADPFMGWGATLVDALDTLWIMGLTSDFDAAVLEVEKIDFHSSLRKDLPLFETVIRYLGGLLAAYDVSGAKYPTLLTKAEELAEVLMGAFDTPNRMPMTFYNWAPSYASQPHRANAHTVMAELGSLSMEFTRLAQITKKQEYYDAIARITNELQELQSKTLIPGLWPLKVDASGCKKAEISMVDEDYEMDGEYYTDLKPVLVDTGISPLRDDAAAISPAKVVPNKHSEYSNNVVKRLVRPDTKYRNNVAPLKEVEQEILAVECTTQGLAAAPNTRLQTFGIGGQADSTYEYLPKMHQLMRGRAPQYENMYMKSVRAIKDKLLFRPMIQDEDREILFASKHVLNPKTTIEKKKKEVVYEVTHLSCFIGGMLGLGAKIFGIDGDLELAKQLTDGCVWAYESMPTGVMAEVATIVPCPSTEVCAWNEEKWHDALDPQLEERIAAVDAWNAKQKDIYEKSKKQALQEAAVDKVETSSAGPQPTKQVEQSHFDPEKRQLIYKEPSRTSVKLEPEEKPSQAVPSVVPVAPVAVPVAAPISFVPKVALSHDKYVKARIQEERLPPSYTKITSRYYSLRPEAIESIFYMYRITGDEIWRQKGWKMFAAVQSATQTETANAAMMDVTSHLGELEDSMESFWLAETLKYFYLLFSEPELMDLDQWVANTEAHFFKIPA